MTSTKTYKFSPAEFRLQIAAFAQQTTRRTIVNVDLHHTYVPDHELYFQLKAHMGQDAAAQELHLRMHRYHTQQVKMRDIAQHVTIDPDGGIWMGRNWNWAPASARGHNGNRFSGPFMIETIGDFDVGRDPFEGAQMASVLQVIAAVQEAFDLPLDTLRFHNEMSLKSCPGTQIDKAALIADVGNVRANFAPLTVVQKDINRMADLNSRSASVPDIDEGELPENEMSSYDVSMINSGPESTLSRSGKPRSQDDFTLSRPVLRKLRSHVINMNAGKLEKSGDFTTDEGDVDDLINQQLRAWVQNKIREGETPHIVIYAHGGLTSEHSGLRQAYGDADWWLKQGIYPLFLVWETGICETIFQIFDRFKSRERFFGDVIDRLDAARKDAQDVVFEEISEVVVKPLWNGIKINADLACANDDAGELGGCSLVVKNLQTMFRNFNTHARLRNVLGAQNAVDDEQLNKLRPRLHLVGHSAGTILHNRFAGLMHEAKLPIETISYLAPACTVSDYRTHLEPLFDESANQGDFELPAIRRMQAINLKTYDEKRDSVRSIYNKSILYLVRNALETPDGAPLLGLEESFRSDGALRRSFETSQRRVFYSPTEPGASMPLRSGSQTHSFDQDADTFNALACYILGVDEIPTDRLYKARRPELAVRGLHSVSSDSDLDDLLDAAGFSASPPTQLDSPLSATSSTCTSPVNTTSTGGVLRALTIGNDDYQTDGADLAACISDMTAWEDCLRNTLGFDEVSTLPNARLAEMNEGMSRAIQRTRSGDVLVIHYSGHGTYRQDVSGDEDDGRDEGLVPTDDLRGEMMWDDDIRPLYDRIDPGAHVFVFMDCCHSGSNSRFGFGGASPRDFGGNKRARFFPYPQRFMRGLRNRGSRTHFQAADNMRHIQFSACLDHQLAMEENGHGDFTRYMLEFIRELPTDISCWDAQREVERKFVANGKTGQTPLLMGSYDRKDGPFLTTLLRRLGRL